MNNLNLDTSTKGREELAGEGSYSGNADGNEDNADYVSQAHSPRRVGQSYDNATSELKEKSDDEGPPHRRYRSQSQYDPGIEAALSPRDDTNGSDVVTNLNEPSAVLKVFEGRAQKELTLMEQRRLRLKLLHKLNERSVLDGDCNFLLGQGRRAWVRLLRSLHP